MNFVSGGFGQNDFLLNGMGAPAHLTFDEKIRAAATASVHNRAAGNCKNFGLIDIITASHIHTDRLHAETLRVSFQVKPGIGVGDC